MAGARQPIELIQAKGKKHLTAKEIEERKQTEVKAPDNNVHAPEYLNVKQVKAFNALADELKNANIMTNLDCDLLAKFVISNNLYEVVTAKLFDPEVQDDIFAFEKLSNMQDKYFKQCLSASKEMGMTISARCKLVTPKIEKEDNPLKKALMGDD